MDGGSEIRMSPSELETEANGFESDRDNFEMVVNSMSNRIDRLSESWKGQASTAFATQFADLEPSFGATIELIGDIAAQLKSIANAMVSSDSDIASQIGVK